MTGRGGVSFGEAIGEPPVSDEARAVGETFARAIPQPSVENGGLRLAAMWWAHWVGGVIPLQTASHGKPKTPNSGLLGGGGWTAAGVMRRDADGVAAWWDEVPMANIGFPTQANRVLIVDLDPRNGGLQSFALLCSEHDFDASRVPRSLSPRGDGGCHLWFALPDGTEYAHSKLAPGIDRPWQVPVPPSLRNISVSVDASAVRPYVWSVGDPRSLPTAPGWMLGAGVKLGSTGESVDADSAEGRIGPDVVDALVRTGIPVGEQNRAFSQMACSMVARGWPDSVIIQTLLETAQQSPIGRQDDPWTREQLAKVVEYKRKWVIDQRVKEAARNREFVEGLTRR